MMRLWSVTLPIAGHAFLEVEAETEEQAREMAFNTVTFGHVEEWEALEQFSQGNVCYCPSPWQVEITDEGEVE